MKVNTEINLRMIERRWQSKWRESKIFDADPLDKPKFYLNVAYPYPSGPMHVGHARTYTIPDVIARYKRAQGYNVLLPMAFHVTGNPVVGVSRRIARGDETAIRQYQNFYKIPSEILESFTDPYEVVKYFSKEYMELMDQMGYSIDWRRKFTTVDLRYQEFIKWQCRKLMERGLITRGEHPVKYCPSCENPVGDHDLLYGEGSRIVEFVLIKFRLDEYIIPTATLRPETIYGVTNLWINPTGEYVKANVNGESWIISKESTSKLSQQGYEVEIKEKVSASDLLDEQVINPITGDLVRIMAASFVDPDMATGIVMSVPAHAPYDYVATLGKGINPIKIIETEPYGKIPAKDVVELLGVETQDDPKLERATEILYGAEHAKGVMLSGKYVDMPTKEARELIKGELVEDEKASIMYEFDKKPVTCRCGSKIHIKLIKDQWFLEYSDKDWKKEVKERLADMKVMPSWTKSDFINTIDQLHDWACARRIGLGTKIPWDPKWTIEPLSDSTIYMAYYTIAHLLKNIPIEDVNDSVFDYVFLGIGDVTGLRNEKLLRRMRAQFSYWYPYDLRLSAKDLVSNHLTFQLFHHAAIFPDDFPKAIAVFGMSLLEGEKMSSSKGNIILLSDALSRYSADVVRMYLCESAEPWQDLDWRDELVESTEKRIKRFYELACEIMNMEEGEKELERIDRWLLHRLQKRIKGVISVLDRIQTREAIQQAFFQLDADLRWYRRRTGLRKGARWTLKIFLDAWIRLLAPFIPHVCEELWSKIGEGFVSTTSYPSPDPSYIDERVETEEKLIMDTYEDINEIIKVTHMKPARIYLYVSPSWKKEVVEEIMASDDVGEIMRGHAKKGEGVQKFIKKVISEMKKGKTIPILEEKEILTDAKGFFESEFECKFYVMDADTSTYDPLDRGKLAEPMRPAIWIE